MTLKNKLINADLIKSEGKPEERDRLLISLFSNDSKGLTEILLSKIRSKDGSLYDRIKYAATIFSEALEELDTISEHDVPSQFTGFNLAAIVYRDWDRPSKKKDYVIKAIQNVHQEDLNSRKKTLNFKELKSIQLFREELSFNGKGLYQGNLYSAREYWQNFQPSNADFLKNIKIPTSLGFLESLLLGIFWADGFLAKWNKTSVISLYGNKKDYNANKGIDFYGGVVIPLLEKVHNYYIPVNLDFIKKDKNFKRNDYYLSPQLNIISNAICSWLHNDLYFPLSSAKKENKMIIPFNQFMGLSSMYGLFAGIISSMGVLHAKRDLTLNDDSKGFIDDIYKLAKILDYSPSTPKKSKGKTSWYIYFPKKDVQKMANINLDYFFENQEFKNKGLFFNPRHHQYLAN